MQERVNVVHRGDGKLLVIDEMKVILQDILILDIDELFLSEIIPHEAIIHVDIIAPSAVAEIWIHLDVPVKGIVNRRFSGGVQIQSIQLISHQLFLPLPQFHEIGSIDVFSSSKRIGVGVQIPVVRFSLVSAGHGDFLDSDYYTTIEVPARDAKGADFAVTISGDSMEPAFHDHDMVYVHQQETLDDGEIGIFSLNDNAYIKQLKNDSDGTFLISLNQKYAPIPVHLDRDDFRIFGKVCRATR